MKSIPIAMLLLTLPLAAEEQEMKTLLQQGLVAEEVNGDLEAAAAAYQQLVTAGEAQQRLLATGLFRLAEVQRKQGQRDEAVALLQRLVSAHPTQEELVERAREALSGLGAAPPVTPEDSLMPSLATEEAQEIARMERLLRESPDRARKEYPLHLAAEKGWLELARRMIGQGYDVNQVQFTSETFGTASRGRTKTPLAVAAEFGHNEMCKLLLAANADIEAGGARSDTPVRMAVEKQNIGILKLLLAAGASTEVPIHVNWSTSNDMFQVRVLGTPLHYAIRNRSLETAVLLIEAGAKLDSLTSKLPVPPNVITLDVGGQTPLFYALESPEMVDLLLESGANIEAVDEAGRTAVFYAKYRDRPAQPDGAVTRDTLTMLVEAGASLDVRDHEGLTPLLAVASSKHGFLSSYSSLARMLVKLGADPRAVDAGGNGLLHHAALTQSAEVEAVQWLMSLPIDPQLRNKDGKTAMDLALANSKASLYLIACLWSFTIAPDEGVWWTGRELPLRRLYSAMSENEPPPDFARAWLLAWGQDGWKTPRGLPMHIKRLMSQIGRVAAHKYPDAHFMFVISQSSSMEKAPESVREISMNVLTQPSSADILPGTILFFPGNFDLSDVVKSLPDVFESITFRHGEREESFELSTVATSKFSSDPPVKTVGLVYSHYGAVVMAAAAELAAGKISRAKVIREIDGKSIERVIDLETEDPGTWPRPMTGDVVELLPTEKVSGK